MGTEVLGLFIIPVYAALRVHMGEYHNREIRYWDLCRNRIVLRLFKKKNKNWGALECFVFFLSIITKIFCDDKRSWEYWGERPPNIYAWESVSKWQKCGGALEKPVCNSGKGSIFVCLGYHNQGPQTGWLLFPHRSAG